MHYMHFMKVTSLNIWKINKLLFDLLQNLSSHPFSTHSPHSHKHPINVYLTQRKYESLHKWTWMKKKKKKTFN